MLIQGLADNRLIKFVSLSNEMAKCYSRWTHECVDVAKSFMLVYEYINEILKKRFSQKDIKFYTFYLDLAISKLRRFTFSEVKVIFGIHPLLVRDIAYTAQRLSIENGLSFNIDFQRLAFKLFLMYDFISYENYGIFTRFKLNKNLFMKVRKIFSLDNIMDLPTRLIREFLKFYGYSESGNPYERLIGLAKKDKVILFEPFSYYLAYKIWKISKCVKLNEKFIEEYISKNIDTIFKFYNKKVDNLELFRVFYELDKNLIKEGNKL